MAEHDDLSWEQRIRNLNPSPDSSMAVIRGFNKCVENDLSVFPPINHENLLISSSGEGDDLNRDAPSPSSSMSSSSSRSASSSTFSLTTTESDEQHPWSVSDFGEGSSSTPHEMVGKSSTKQSDCSIQVPNRVQKWWKILIMFLQSNIHNISSWFAGRDRGSAGGTALQSFFLFIPAAASLIWWWMQVRARRRRSRGKCINHLRRAVKEKDEKIIELLHQIAQMNAFLIERQKAVTS